MRLIIGPTLHLAAIALLSACGAQTGPSSSTPAAAGRTIKVLDYNAYLLTADSNGSPSLPARLAALPDAIAALDADVVIMQEVWSRQHRAELAKGMAAKGYQGAAREIPSLWPPYNYGNGLYIFVRAPLALSGETAMLRYQAADLLNFDKFTTKGAIRVKVAVPDAGSVDVVAAHTSYLPFSKETHDFDRSLEPQLLRQTRAVARFLGEGQSPVKILGGDFNTHPMDWQPDSRSYSTERKTGVYGILTGEAALTDAMAAAAPQTCQDFCATWDNVRNAHIRQGIFGGVPGDTTEPDSRIDYVMVSGQGASVAASSLALTEERELEVRDPGTGAVEKRLLPLSDHYGVLTEIRLDPQ